MMCDLQLPALHPATPIPHPAHPGTESDAPAEPIVVEEQGMTATDQVNIVQKQSCTGGGASNLCVCVCGMRRRDDCAALQLRSPSVRTPTL